jgi:preprotein translocase subunit SecY
MFRNIADTFANCFKVPELKSRIWFTVCVLFVVRIISFVRVPGLDGDVLTKFFNSHAQSGGGAMGMYNMFAGGALERCAIGAIGIMPYISATIIIQ